jgi:hypothetical protein
MSPKEGKMGRKKVYAMIASIVAVAAVALLLGFVVIPGSSTSTETATVAATSGSPSEGITVHGHWTVDVLNPDGTLAEHREFENSIAPEGQGILTSILAGTLTVGRWSIMLDGSPAHPCRISGDDTVCYIVERDYPDSGTDIFKTLSKTLGGSLSTATLILYGTFTVGTSTDITFVTTTIEYCSGSISPIACGDITGISDQRQMTATGVSPAIEVQIGQQVQVTVEISFN